MHRIDGAGHVDHLFVAEDPATLRPPTEITPEIMNAFQEELATFIEWAGIVLAKGDNSQLKQALLAKFAGFDVAATKAGVQAQTYTAFTTAGGTGAFVLTPNPAITAYAAGQRFRVKFHAVGNGADVINVSTLGNKNLKQYDAAGNKVPAIIKVGQLVDMEFDGADFILIDPLPAWNPQNVLLNGAGQVALSAAANIGTSLAYGAADMWLGSISPGTVSAGTLSASTGLAFGTTGCAAAVLGLTTGAGSQLNKVIRIEAADAKRYNGKTVTFSVLVYHDAGAAINFQANVRKANAADNFGAVTALFSGAVVAVANATATLLTATGTLGNTDASNGLEFLISAACGAVVTKNFYFTDAHIDEGLSAQPYVPDPIDIVHHRCERYFERTYIDGLAAGTISGSGAATGVTQGGAVGNAWIWMRYRTKKRVNPTLSFYNPNSLNATNQMSDQGGSTATIGIMINNEAAWLIRNAGGALSANNYCYVHCIADARLY